MSLGFGIERLGLVSALNPWVILVLVALAVPLFAYGASQVGFTSDIRQIFETSQSEFTTLDKIGERFPGTTHEVDVVVSGKQIFTEKSLGNLRRLKSALGNVDGVNDVLSVFSAAGPAQGASTTEPLIPDDLSTVENFDRLRLQVAAHPLVADKLLSRDGRLAVISLRIEGNSKSRTVEETRILVDEIREAARQALSQSDLVFQLTGVSVMRVEIIGALIQDQQLLRYGALVLGLGFCWIFFGNLRQVVIAGAPAAIAVLFLIGGMGLVGQDIDVLTNVVPVIVLVIVFSDSVHMLYAIRENLDEGCALKAAVDKAVREVGPACVLTSLTTTLAFLSLMFVEHSFVRNFGQTAAFGTALALVATLFVVPALSMILLRNEKARCSDRTKATQTVMALCRAAASLAKAAPLAIAAGGLVIAVVSGALHLFNEPKYRYTDNLPRDNPAYRALTLANEKLAGASTLFVLIDWPDGMSFVRPNTLEAVSAVHKAVAEEPAFSGITSLHSVEAWLSGKSPDDANGAALLSFLAGSNVELNETLASLSDNSALVTARFGDLSSAELVPKLDRLDERLKAVTENFPDVAVEVTGAVPISARASYDMISQLNRSLLMAIGIIIAAIALAMRSARQALASILPNILPVAIGGLYLFASGQELQFTSVIAFTIGFGLAVDSTIHMLNRYRLLRRKSSTEGDVVSRTLIAVGPVVVISSLVVGSGLAITLASELPMVRLYGIVAVVVLAAALIADLLVLPATLEAMEKWFGVRPSRPKRP